MPASPAAPQGAGFGVGLTGPILLESGEKQGFGARVERFSIPWTKKVVVGVLLGGWGVILWGWGVFKGNCRGGFGSM